MLLQTEMSVAINTAFCTVLLLETKLCSQRAEGRIKNFYL